MKNEQTGVECRPARLLCIIAALSDVSRRRPPVPASAPWSRAASGCFSAPDPPEILQAVAPAPFVPAVTWGRSKIRPWLPSVPERFLLQFMRVFRCVCRQIEPVFFIVFSCSIMKIVPLLTSCWIFPWIVSNCLKHFHSAFLWAALTHLLCNSGPCTSERYYKMRKSAWLYICCRYYNIGSLTKKKD